MASERLELAREHGRKREALTERLKVVLIEQLNLAHKPDEIAEDTTLFGGGLGLDSVDALEIVVCIEGEFGIRITDQDMQSFRTLNTVVDLIEKRIEQ
jgi:acyl carrier protein